MQYNTNKLSILDNQALKPHEYARVPSCHPRIQQNLIGVFGEAMKRCIEDVSEIASHVDKFPVITDKDLLCNIENSTMTCAQTPAGAIDATIQFPMQMFSARV